jgi:hypothetical protein
MHRGSLLFFGWATMSNFNAEARERKRRRSAVARESSHIVIR